MESIGRRVTRMGRGGRDDGWEGRGCVLGRNGGFIADHDVALFISRHIDLSIRAPQL